MGMKGATHDLLMDRGGFQFPQNIDLADQAGMLDPTSNIIFTDGGRQKRRGTTQFEEAPDGGFLQGLVPFQKLDGTYYLLGITDLGNVYNLATSTFLGTFSAAGNPVSGVVFDDAAYITNSEGTPKSYNGVSLTTMPNVPTDWGVLGPKQFLVRRAGNTNRMVGIGVPEHENEIYYSAANSSDFSDANVTVLPIEVGESGGLIGGIEFGNRLVVFSRSYAFIVDDTNASPNNWTWERAQWTGGAYSWLTVCKTQNDLFALMGDGEIYSVVTAQEYGDYKAASVARPAWIHRWIRDNIDLEQLRFAHSVYDPELRCVYWFLPRFGFADFVDLALVYFIDRPPAEAWVIHGNSVNPSGFGASISVYGRVPGEEFFKVMTGTGVGQVWYLNSSEAGLADDSEDYESGFSTTHMHFGNPRSRKRYKYGHVITSVQGDFDLEVDLYIDGIFRETKIIELGVTGGVYGVGQYGTATYGGDEYLIGDFPIEYIGTRLQYRMRNNNAGEDFFVSRIMTDFKELGLRPASSIANR